MAEDVEVGVSRLVPLANRLVRGHENTANAAAVLGEDFVETKSVLLSPAQAEKVLKKRGLPLPGDLVVAVSSGNTIAPENDPRSAVVLIGQQLTAALSKLQ